MIEERIAGGPELYQSEKSKYFQGSWSGEPFNNKVRFSRSDRERCDAVGQVDTRCCHVQALLLLVLRRSYWFFCTSRTKLKTYLVLI